MKGNLKTKVSVFVAAVIVTISVVSTLTFLSFYTKSKEKGRIARGSALSFSLSKAAEEGLINEDLDLIKKASNIVKTPDVATAQVYSDIWEVLDSYPIEKLKLPPDTGAMKHFASSHEPYYVKTEEGFDFYSPILFRTSEEAPATAIGFVRMELSTADIKREMRQIVAANIVVASVITLVAILVLNRIIGRLVLEPVLALYRSVSLFKTGIMPEPPSSAGKSTDEIHELASEFHSMCTAIKEDERRLMESDRRIRTLFERVEHAVFRLDAAGEIVEANSRFRDLFGDADGLCDILIGEKSATECLRRASHQKSLHIEDKAVGKKGEELMVSLTLYPDAGADGKPVGFDGYLMDVTEKKRLEERLVRAQKMEAVGTLAGGMAHDFNNLLTAILGYSEIILSTSEEGDPYHKPANIIYEAAKRGAEFGKKILTITRKEKLETRPVDVNEIVRSSIELIQRSFPKNIEVVVALKEGLPLLKADPSQLQQVIINLAVNARDAMPKGGKLAVETSLVRAEKGITPESSRDGGGFIRISVSDTGTGIDIDTQTKIFDPFFTTKDIGHGTGLGLYIVHSIVNNHGGYINLYSEPQKGTQFSIYLPIAETLGSEANREVADIRGSGMILVIDDEADVRELCRDMLEPLGYTVLSAGDGMAGVNVFRELKGKISLVILDMIMPRMGGREVFEALKNIAPNAKVLLCSGYSQNGFAGIDELLGKGAVAFVQKPFSRQNIGLAIKQAILKQP